jgi:transcription-repair coupling factor (superfamily II helicase)
VGVAHGQMHEDALEETMLAFYNKDYDVLVCTTIIESGLDVSNVNTIVVDNADKLGLAQLYQLRGRVGRSDRQGYAFLLYRQDKVLSEVAEKRLFALKEFTDLGSGYKIALRDLEIRGAGNLLGREQSGTVAAVGFDLYTQLLSQAIQEYKGEPVDEEFTLPSVTLPIDAHIPSRYIPSEAERILIYKRMTAIRCKEDVDDVQAELEDRYGDPPRSVWNLLGLLRLRLRCKQLGVGSITTEKTRMSLHFAGTHLPQDSIRALSRAMLQCEFRTHEVVMPLPESPLKVLNTLEEMLEILVQALPDKEREARVGIAPGLSSAPMSQHSVRRRTAYRSTFSRS